ncbi:MAG: phytoene desaturase [Fimbriimonadaceae bacterium]|nr:phytoene desaturase [Fimbriimonadaceae bacterium]
MARNVVIVGAGLGGLSAAIHARLRGWDVLVLEQSDRTGGKAAGIEIDGFHLDPGPSIIIVPEIYRDVFRAAGRNPDDYLQFERLSVLSRIYFEGSETVDLPADYDECLRLLRGLAPDDEAAFRALISKLDGCVPNLERAVFERPILKQSDFMRPGLLSFGMKFNPFRTYKDMVDGWFSSPLLRAFFYGFPSYSGQTYRDNAPGALLIPYYMLQSGVYFPRGGVRAIPAAFERLASELGVEFRFGARFKQFVGEQSVELDGGEILEADGVICNIDKLTATGETQVEPSMSYFTLHWGLRRELSGLEHHTLLIPKDFERGFKKLYANQFPNPPIAYLNATAALDPEAAPPGCTNLFAVVTVPADVPALDWHERRDEYRDLVLSVIRKAGFEWDDAEILFERVQDPPYFAQAHGNYRGSLYGPTQKHRAFGLFPLMNWDSKHPHRAYCGGSVQPGAGLPMVTLSGKFAVDSLAKVARG